MGLVASGTLAAFVLVGVGDAPADVSSAVREILEREAGVVERARDLVALGDHALPLLVRTFDSEAEAPGADATEHSEVALRALEAWDDVAFRSYFQDLLALPADTAEGTNGLRVSLLRLLTEIGSAEEMPLAVAASETASEDVRRRVADALTLATEGILRRDQRTWVGLSAEAKRSSAATTDALLRAAGRVGGPRGAEVLGDLLGFAPELDHAVLSQLSCAVRPLHDGLPAWIAERVRGYLAHTNSQVQRTAATLSGDLNDHEAVPRLIDLLTHDAAPVRSASAWGLGEITGLRLGEDHARWNDWYSKESSWFGERAEQLFIELESPDPTTVRAALFEVARHQIHRDTLAIRVRHTLDHEDPAIRNTACSVLGQLGVRATAPDLIALLHGDTARAARDALEAITGLNLPADPDAWNEALSPPAGSGAGRFAPR